MKSADILPKAKVKASQFQVHISYLLQKCKKSKTSEKGFAHFEKTISQQL